MIAVFTVYFEDPFWVGLLESEEAGSLVVARHVFGPEPSNAELLEFMLYRFAYLPRTAIALDSGGEAANARPKPPNPKRARREAMRDMERRRPSTKAQAALSASREEAKDERRREGRAHRREGAERRFELRAEKKKLRRAGKR